MNYDELFEREEERLKKSKNPSESANILFNIIALSFKSDKKNDIYKDAKRFIDCYVELIKSANYGYDSFNFNKLEKLLNMLPPEEQVAILQYALSITARELPEHSVDWFI